MPKPRFALTFRQERFCHAYLRLANAAVEAGYAERSARNQAYRLLRTRRIRERLADIQEDTALHDCAGLHSALAKLQNVDERAIEARHLHAAARAVEIQSRLLGLHLGRSPLSAAARCAAALRSAPAPALPPEAFPRDDLSDVAPWPTGDRKW